MTCPAPSYVPGAMVEPDGPIIKTLVCTLTLLLSAFRKRHKKLFWYVLGFSTKTSFVYIIDSKNENL